MAWVGQFLSFSLANNITILQISQNSTHKFFSVILPTYRQTDRQANNSENRTLPNGNYNTEVITIFNNVVCCPHNSHRLEYVTNAGMTGKAIGIQHLLKLFFETF